MLTNKWKVKTSTSKFIYSLPTKHQQASDVNELLEGGTYALLFGRDEYEIICPKIRVNGIEYLFIPKLLIPGRPYPIYVYLFGIALYSSNPKMGQREAAEKTRKRFDLATFSHTTLGRAMKRLEIRIKSFRNKPIGDEPLQKNSVISPACGKTELREQRNCAVLLSNTRCFPSVEHTHERKNTVISFLTEAAGLDMRQIQYTLQPHPSHNYKCPPYKGAFFNVCHKIVGYMFIKYRCLLL